MRKEPDAAPQKGAEAVRLAQPCEVQALEARRDLVDGIDVAPREAVDK